MIEFFVDLIKGLGLNFIITIMAIIVPLILGVAGSLLVKNIKTAMGTGINTTIIPKARSHSMPVLAMSFLYWNI